MDGAAPRTKNAVLYPVSTAAGSGRTPSFGEANRTASDERVAASPGRCPDCGVEEGGFHHPAHEN